MTEENERRTGPSGGPLSENNRFSDLEDQISLKEIALVPWKRKWIVVACTVLCFLMAALYSYMSHPKYRATATIELNEEKTNGADVLSNFASMTSGDPDQLRVRIETDAAVIQGDSIALAVMKSMGMLRLENPDRFSKEPGPLAKSVEELPDERREALIGGFEGGLQVKEIGNSRLVGITYVSENPVEAAAIANEVVHQYKLYLFNSNVNSSKEVSQWLATQLGDLSAQVNKSQQAVAEFERGHNLSAAMLGLGGLSGSSTAGSGGSGGSARLPELDRLMTLNEEVTQAEAVRMGREAVYRMTASENPALISTIGSSSLPGLSSSTVLSQGNGLDILNALREQEATARLAYASAETKYGARNPHLAEIANQLKSLQEQMQAEVAKIKQRAKNDLLLAQQNEQALNSAFEAQKVVTSKMNDDVAQLGVLMEQVRSSRQLYDLLYARLQEANIDAGNSATNVTVADPARPPGGPFMPKTHMILASGFFGGLLLGVCIAFLLESQDDTVTDSFQVESLTNLPVLGMIPFHRADATPREGVLAAESSCFLTAPESATAESFRSLRSGLTLSGVGRRLKVISIISALPGEGKSFTVYNLGLAFAAAGFKTLIIDADLRRSRQHALFRVAREEGLADVLAGLKSFNEVLVPHPVEKNLTLLSAGRLSPLASELLGSGDIKKLLDTAREQFEIVLVDNAPALPVADAIVIGTYCDGCIGVLRAGRTSRKALRRFVQSLARNHIHILGMVIEAVDMSATEYRSVYGYNVQSYYGNK